MWSDIKDFYRSAWAFSRSCPILFLIPVMVEMAQHIAEIHIGMYASAEAARAVADHPLRMGFAVAKIVSLALPGYWFTRYLAYGWSPESARTIDRRGLGLWSILFVFSLTIQLYTLFGPPLGTALGLSGQLGEWLGASVSFVWAVIGIYFTAWIVAWTLGNVAIGPVRSARIMAGHFWRTVIYLLAGVIPLMIVHYAFGWGAIGRPDWLVWPMMILDAAVVGWLALTIVAPGWYAAKHAADANSVSLLPDRTKPG